MADNLKEVWPSGYEGVIGEGLSVVSRPRITYAELEC